MSKDTHFIPAPLGETGDERITVISVETDAGRTLRFADRLDSHTSRMNPDFIEFGSMEIFTDDQ